MRNFQPRKKFKGILHSRPVIILLGVVFFFSLWSFIGFVGKLGVTRENRNMAENKLAELQQEKERLSSEIVKLETESGIEENIRLKFGLAKEGEGVIVVVEEPELEDEDEEPKKRGFFSFFKNLFK